MHSQSVEVKEIKKVTEKEEVKNNLIPLNQKTKLPWSVRFYEMAWLFIIYLAIASLFSIGSNGTDALIPLGGLMIVVALWQLLDYACVSYIVSENTMTINTGILIKRSQSIPFSNVQNVNNSRGLLAMIFGISRVNIWTASSAQIQINKGNSNNKPSGSLFFRRDEAE
jgi:membrane protein YdbS with pleckstrin-like domain